MNKLEKMTNKELKAYIKANRDDELICHEVIKILINRQPENTPRYSYNLPQEEIKKIFEDRLKS